MGYWKELPYRGSREPKARKPRRQVRDLQKEKRENILTIIITFIVSIIFSFFLISSPEIKSDEKGSWIIVLIFIFVLNLGLVHGLISVNRFRKGYDFDTSFLEKDNEDNNEEENKIG
jgi:hypothetical protein